MTKYGRRDDVMIKKLVAFALSAIMVVGVSTIALASASASNINAVQYAAALTSEEELISKSRKLVDEALAEKKFYKYNIAYASVNSINDVYIKGELLGKLATISDLVFTPEINRYIGMLTDLVQSGGSGKLYDEIEADFRKSPLDDFDKGYLLGELTGWGKKLVYTPDYQTAVDRVVDAWTMLSKGSEANTNAAIAAAEKAINGIKNRYSKDYLTEQLEQIKLQTEFTVIEIS
jgi:hypothetical protein